MIRSRTLVLAVALAVVASACADDGDTDEPAADDTTIEEEPEDAAEDEAAEDDAEGDATEDEAAEDEAAEDEATEDGAAEGAASVAVDSTELGEVLVDADGMTLYLFDPDEQGESQCYDDCEANWPPLVTEGEPTAEAGADGALLGTVERDDGTLQVTYDGWPLYHFIADEAPGDVNGQGVQDVWWVLGADGSPLRDTEAADDEEAGGSGY